MPIGFTRSKIIEIAHIRTEKKAKNLDQNAEFALALQELCLSRRWWWRRKIKSFTVETGTPTYQFAGSGSLALEDFQQAPKDGLKLFISNNQIVVPEPVFTLEQQQMILSFQASLPPGCPTGYFIVGAPGKLTLDPVPDKDYLASLAYWAVPPYVIGGETGEEELIPLVPAYFHPLLIKRLELHFMAYSLGEGSAKYVVAQAEYAKMENDADLYNNFSEGEVKNFASDDITSSVRSS